MVRPQQPLSIRPSDEHQARLRRSARALSPETSWNRHDGPWPVNNVLSTVTLIAEAARVSKVHPAVVPAFADTSWRTTLAFIIRDIHRRRASPRDNERVVHHDLLGSEILGPVHAALHLLEGLPRDERFLAAT